VQQAAATRGKMSTFFFSKRCLAVGLLSWECCSTTPSERFFLSLSVTRAWILLSFFYFRRRFHDPCFPSLPVMPQAGFFSFLCAPPPSISFFTWLFCVFCVVLSSRHPLHAWCVFTKSESAMNGDGWSIARELIREMKRMKAEKRNELREACVDLFWRKRKSGLRSCACFVLVLGNWD